jgi:hypothetical protein
LRILLIVQLSLLALFVLTQIDRSQVKRLSPALVKLFNVFDPPDFPDVSAAGRRFMEEVKARGGSAKFNSERRSGLWRLGTSEWFSVTFAGVEVTDETLAFLARNGEQIRYLYLVDANIDDAKMRHIAKMKKLRHLTLGTGVWTSVAGRAWLRNTITDSGLTHLKGLTGLESVNLDGLPVTDAGLDALKDVPNLGGLYLNRTKVKCETIATFASLPNLALIYLDKSEVTPDGLRALSGGSNLRVVSLEGVAMTGGNPDILKTYPRLNQLNVTGCGLLDEEVAALKSARPDLKIDRR